jgi:tripartite-type tricarboxylate transporter receptor subunit TctC
MWKRISSYVGTMMAVAAIAVPMQAAAQAYPARPVRIIVPLAPGGITDIAARLVAAKLGERLGQPVIVENKTGANQTIGSEFVARSAPDGYTLIMATVSSHAVNASLLKDLRYSIRNDFAAVSMTTSQPLLLVVHPSIPANSVPELLQLLKSNPGKYSFGSPGGTGTSGFMAAEFLKAKTGISMVHIPYKGSGPMLSDLVGGQIDLAFDNMPTALAQVKGGKLRALAVTSAERSEFASELPAMVEFIPDFKMTAWQGLFAPAGTPPAVLERLSTEVQQIMRMPDVVARMREMGTTSVGSTRAEFAAFVKEEIDRWAEVVRVSGAKVE